jgi:hypothetical protein
LDIRGEKIRELQKAASVEANVLKIDYSDKPRQVVACCNSLIEELKMGVLDCPTHMMTGSQ